MSDGMKTCPRCSGAGTVPVVRCDECKGVADDDGYCDACATAAVERYKAEHGGRSPSVMVAFRLNAKGERLSSADALAKAVEGLVNAIEEDHSESACCSVCYGWRPDEHEKDCALAAASAALSAYRRAGGAP